MRRAIGVLVLMLTVCVIVAVGAFPHSPKASAATHPLCEQQATSATGVRALIVCLAPHYGVSTSRALYIAHRESRYQPRVHKPRSSACGVYQVVAGTWAYFVRHFVYGRGLWIGRPFACENGRANVILSLRYVRHHGWGPWRG